MSTIKQITTPKFINTSSLKTWTLFGMAMGAASGFTLATILNVLGEIRYIDHRPRNATLNEWKFAAGVSLLFMAMGGLATGGINLGGQATRHTAKLLCREFSKKKVSGGPGISETNNFTKKPPV